MGGMNRTPEHVKILMHENKCFLCMCNEHPFSRCPHLKNFEIKNLRAERKKTEEEKDKTLSFSTDT